MKTIDKALAALIIVGASAFYVGGHLAYNEDGYSMLVTNPTGDRWVTHEPGFYWLDWDARTDRYRQRFTHEFATDAVPYKYEYGDEKSAQ